MVCQRKLSNPNPQSELQNMLQATVCHIAMRDAGVEIADIANYCPDDPLNFEVIFEVFVRLDGGRGSDRFDITVCTLSSVEENMTNGIIMGHGMLIVEKYSFEMIVDYIHSYIKMCKGRCVEDVYRRVGLLGEWEYEWEL